MRSAVHTSQHGTRHGRHSDTRTRDSAAITPVRFHFSACTASHNMVPILSVSRTSMSDRMSPPQ